MSLAFEYTDSDDMTVTHNILCGHIHSCVHSTGGAFQGQRNHWPYLVGNSEICSGYGPYQLESLALLRHPTFVNPKIVYDYLRSLRVLINSCVHGKLTETHPTGLVLNEWLNCTWDQAEAITMSGQERPFPVPDPCGANSTYAIRVSLVWTQLHDEAPAPAP